MSTINISLAEVSDTAARLRSLGASMYDELNQMKKEMNSLSSTWISEGSEEIRSRFNMFANRFEKHKADIDAYAKYLELTVSSYDTLESTITSNASGMQY
ncbi:MAG: pore-forming ESAT-6 family protein [Erysipelotrichaceae bacterium]|nr:pore-forming ESAT-6 family protein [Erysipelotrichaceae bacterium]